MRIDSLLRPSAHSFLASQRRLTFSNGVSIPTSARATLGLGLMLVAGATLAGPLAASPTLGGDENGPKIQILTPGYQDILKGRTRILIGVSTTKFNPATVQLFVDGKDASSGPIKLAAFASSSFDWDTRLFSDGQHKLTVLVTDTQGFRGWADVTIFINNNNVVDTAPPTLDWQNVQPFQQLSGTSQIQLDAKDNFGVKYLIVSIASTKDPKKKLRSWFLNEPPYTFNLDTTKLDDDTYYLEAKANDSHDQEGEARRVMVGVVNNPINATTVDDALKGYERMANVAAGLNPKPTVPPTNFTSKTVDAGPSGPVRPNTGNVSTPGNATVRNNAKILGGVTPKLAPPVGVTGTSIPNPTVPTTNNVEVAALPTQDTNQDTQGTLSIRLGKVLDGARTNTIAVPKVSVEGQGHNVRISQPLGTQRTYLAPAQLSSGSANSALNGVINTDVVADVAPSTPKQAHTEIARLAAPAGEERLVGSPVFSEKTSDETLAIANALNLSSHQGDIEANTASNFTSAVRPASPLMAERAVPAVQQPVQFSSGASFSPAMLAPSLASTPAETPASTRNSKLTAPETRTASVPVAASQTAPVLSDSGTSADTVRSTKSGSLMGSLRNKVQDLSKARPSNNIGRIGMLPPMGNEPSQHEVTGNSPRAAITASPLEVSAQNSIPASHRVERETTLRAIAARYGVPVELVATANGWKTDMRVVKGMTVKLPQPLQLSYNGVPVAGDVPSMLAGDTAVAAFRFMFQQAGGKMEWDAKNHQVIARKGNSQIVVKIGSNVARVNNKDVMMELAAFLFEGRTMVPLRFFEEGLNAEVEWDPQTGRIVMAMAG